MDVEHVAGKLLRPLRIPAAPSSPIVEGGDFAMCDGDFWNPLPVWRGDGKTGSPSFHVGGFGGNKSLPGTYHAGQGYVKISSEFINGVKCETHAVLSSSTATGE